MSSPPPHDPYGQGAYNQPDYGQPEYRQAYPYELGQEAFPSSYASDSRSSGSATDLASLVRIGAWVVLALFCLAYLYGLGQEHNGADVADRLFGLMPMLGEGVFYSGLLHGVAVWLDHNKDAG